MPWWGGFDPRVWRKLDAWLDWVAPLAAVTSKLQTFAVSLYLVIIFFPHFKLQIGHLAI